MKSADDRRKLADLCRKVASIPTKGGHRADRVLLQLAAELELETAPPAKRATLLKLDRPQ
jgi:hypothetical protein